MKQQGQPVECLDWKARFSGGAEVKTPAQGAEPVYRTVESAKRRRAYFAETGSVDVPVHFGEDLLPGALIDGPAIIEEPTTTIVVFPGTSARVGGSGSYILEPAALRPLRSG